MATPQEKLAQSLEVLQQLQSRQIVAIKTSDISRTHRERLLKHHFIKKVMDGWYISTPPDEQEGDSTSWYASFWKFCAQYLNKRYGDKYCLSADHALQIQAGNKSVPHQLIIRTKDATNKPTSLLFNTSLFSMQSTLPDEAEIILMEGLRMPNLASSLIHCSPAMFTNNTTDVRTALTMVRDASEILPLLLKGQHSVIAGRLAGAFRNIGQGKIADDIIKTMQSADFNIREDNPFNDRPVPQLNLKPRTSYQNRIRLMWHKMRDVVITHFPKAPGLPADQEKYLKQINDIFTTDAYHSLSIERYVVSMELIEKVRTGNWNPEDNEGDRNHRNAMAASGYWLAYQKVRNSIEKILRKNSPGQVVDDEHGDWYRALFEPSVTYGILEPFELAGYRNEPVYISGSKHVPPDAGAVRDAIPELFDLLRQEESPAVRAVLGHFIFVFIHPYKDGNGRIGRFLMNVMLASGGYPWTVIPVEQRDNYMKALEATSVEQNIEPFAKFLAWLVEEGLKGNPVAKPVS